MNRSEFDKLPEFDLQQANAGHPVLHYGGQAITADSGFIWSVGEDLVSWYGTWGPTQRPHRNDRGPFTVARETLRMAPCKRKVWVHVYRSLLDTLGINCLAYSSSDRPPFGHDWHGDPIEIEVDDWEK